MVGLDEAERGGGLHPVEQLLIICLIGLAGGGDAADLGMHAPDAGDHPFSNGSGSIDRDHGRQAGARHARQGIGAEAGVLPDPGADPGLGQFE